MASQQPVGLRKRNGRNGGKADSARVLDFGRSVRFSVDFASVLSPKTAARLCGATPEVSALG